jgi:NitT/TauT family transport system substrate-binding protein
MDQALIYFDNSFKAEIIGITDESVGGDGLVVGNGIENASDLNGKTIAYAEASPSDFFLRYLLKKKGVELDSVRLKPVADPQIAGTTFISGDVDAAVTYEPFLSQSLANEGSKILFSTKEYPTLIPGLIIANGEDVGKRNDLYKKFMTAWFQSVEYYKNNPDESYTIISKGMGMDVEEVKEILDVVDVQSKDQNNALFDKTTEANIYELTESIGEFWKDNGFIKTNDNLNEIVNSSLIDKE